MSFRRFRFYFWIGLSLALIAGCEKYQEESYHISSLDDQSCDKLHATFRIDTVWSADSSSIARLDTLPVGDTVKSVAYSQFSEWFMLIDTIRDSTQTPPKDSIWIHYSVTQDSLRYNLPLVWDSIFNCGEKRDSVAYYFPNALITAGQASFINLSRFNDSTYLLLNVLTEANYVIYASNYLTVALIGEDGEVYGSDREAIELETIFECPVVRSRYEFILKPQKYLISLMRHDKTVGYQFYILLQQEQ